MDNIKSALILVFLCAVLDNGLARTEKISSDGFMFTMPRVLHHGSKSEFCITLFGPDTGSRPVIMSLINAENGKTSTKIERSYPVGLQQCNEFKVPEPGDYELLLHNETDIIHDSVRVSVAADSYIGFVQTDKPQYKPGQTVKFRILILQRDMKPKLGKIKSIFITDPNDIRVKQYMNVEAKGITSLEFQLAEEAKLGKWGIEVTLDNEDSEKSSHITYGHFEVKEYVLPRFEVEITPPPYILTTDEFIEGEVCAKYTYGKPVTGFLDLQVCWGSSYGYRPKSDCIHKVVELDGCYNFSVNATELKGDRHYWYYNAELQVTASVTEGGTGVIVNKTHSGPSERRQPLQIEMDDYTNGFFKPGLPYYGKAIVTKPDGTPAEGELIKITAVDFKNNLRYSSNFTTDSSGMIVYALCSSFTENSTSISIDSEAVLYQDVSGPHHMRLSTPRGYKQIKQWFSPSLSYIQIPRPDGSHKCGDRLTLNIPFTTREGTVTQFQYQVMARGKVIMSGQIPYDTSTSYRGMDLISPPSDVCLQWEEFPTPPPMPPTEIPEEEEEEEGEGEQESEESNKAESDEDDDNETVDEDLEVPPPPPGRTYERIVEPPMEEFHEPVVRSEFVADRVSSFLLHLPIAPIMTPKFTLLVFHVLPDGEVVADSMEFLVEPCLENEVKMEFNKSTVLPGENVNIKLEAAPGSVCGVGIVDKSVNILGGKHQLTQELIFQKIEEINAAHYMDSSIAFRSDDEYCEERIKNLEDGKPNTEGAYWHYSSQYVDAIQAFRSSGFLVLTNLDLETRPCGRNYPIFYDFISLNQGERQLGQIPGPPSSGPLPSRSGPPIVKPSVRSHFPETWLWNLQLVGETGESIMEETAPDTITKWVGNAMCLDQKKGFGISPMTSLTTFQPFFLSLHLPYAAVRGERLPIIFTVYNYLEKCLHIQISLDVGDKLRLHNKRHQDPFCVCGGESHVARFYATPQEIGNLPIIAQAEIVPGLCGNSVDVDIEYVGRSDAVKRKLFVKAEGVEQQYTNTVYMCAKDGQPVQETVILPLPEDGNVVKDSARGEVTIIGDLMGPALTNLDNLVRIPTGCGEQNMVGFVPNIFVLKYLTNTGRLTEEIQEKAFKYMEIGYQRELTYRHHDGSYSAFGLNDPKGSVWLTAFVVKSYAQAKEYIYIDEKDISKSVEFLRRKQLETGCFRETGKVFSSYMMGGLAGGKKESLTSLTAYVLIALLTANVNTSETAIVSAISCINRDFDMERDQMDPYSLALVAYANTLYDSRSRETTEIMAVLDAKARKDGSLKYWGRETAKPKPVNTWYYYAAPSAEVEMTSYALMAYLSYYGQRAIEHSHNVAMWISQQRNPYGGFSSTQDTVVGLNAMSEFASLAFSKDGTEVQISLTGKRMDEKFKVSDREDNTLLLQTAPIPVLPNMLTIKADGMGCALVQSSVYYNKQAKDIQGDEPASFYLTVKPRMYQHDIDRCDRRTIAIFVRNRQHNKFSNGMSLVTVKMVTSWTPIPESLTTLKSQSARLGMKRFEYNEQEGIVTFYFDEFGRRPVEFLLDVEQDRELRVSGAKDAEVKVFQYYETDVSAVRSYGLKTTCGTKAEIPHKQPEIDPLMPFPGQVRVDFSRPRPRSSSDDSSEGCPACITEKIEPKNYRELVCNSTAVYKAISGRNGAKPLKLLQNLRPKKRVKNLNIFSNYKMPAGCECSLLEKPPKRVLILVRQKVEDQLIHLDSSSTIMLMHKKILKGARKNQKSCPLKNDDNS